jgi:hypothetical protein
MYKIADLYPTIPQLLPLSQGVAELQVFYSFVTPYLSVCYTTPSWAEFEIGA